MHIKPNLNTKKDHVQLDEKFSYHGAHRRLTFDLHDENWIPQNVQATKKNVFDWKMQLEKVNLPRDLKDDTKLYQGIRIPCKFA